MKKMKNKISLFTLFAIHPRINRDGKKGHYIKDECNCFECWKEHVGVFSSIKEAEKVIKILVDEKNDENSRWKGWDTYVGFVLDEHYLDDALYGEGNNVSAFESCRSYLSNGEINCISECDDRCMKKFIGTRFPNKHVKKGDIALELCGDYLMPVLVEDTSMTREYWKSHFKPGVSGDYTDDSGLAFSAFNGHVHPFAPMLFPMSCLPYAKILKNDISKMKRERDHYYNGK